MSEDLLLTTDKRLKEIITSALAQLAPGRLSPELLELEKLKHKRLLNEEEVEKLYGISKATLKTWRSRGKGPEFSKVGGSVGYEPKILDRFVEERRQRRASGAGGLC